MPLSNFALKWRGKHLPVEWSSHMMNRGKGTCSARGGHSSVSAMAFRTLPPNTNSHPSAVQSPSGKTDYTPFAFVFVVDPNFHPVGAGSKASTELLADGANLAQALPPLEPKAYFRHGKKKHERKQSRGCRTKTLSVTPKSLVFMTSSFHRGFPWYSITESGKTPCSTTVNKAVDGS